MKSYVYGLLIVLIIYFLYTSNVRQCSHIDGRCYKVINQYDPNTFKKASNMLAYLNEFALKLMKHLRNKYLWSSASIYHRDLAEYLLFNYNPDNIIENAPKSDVNTSYVEDKGRIFAICLREKQTGNHLFHDTHILEFVVMHEMAHLATREIGHTQSFWKNFKILLQEAKSIGLHEPADYASNPVVYCSLKVDYSPYFDDTITIPR